jgi:hypothetical protein
VLAYWTPGTGGVGTLDVKGSWTWPGAKTDSGNIVGDAVFIEGATGTQFFPNEKTFTNDLGDPTQSAPNDGMHLEEALTSQGITADTGTFDVTYTNVPASLFSSYGAAPRVLLVFYNVRAIPAETGNHWIFSSGSGYNVDNTYKAGTDTTVIQAFLPPTSTSSAPSFSYDPAWDVSYTAHDTGGPGLREVDLYAKGPSDSSFSKVASTTTSLAGGNFGYDATEGDGSYSFYTVAIDTNGVSGNPSATASTNLFPLPSATCSAPATSSSTKWTVSYTGADTGGPGLSEVDLYARGPSDSSASKVASTTTSLASGSFSYTATEGNGSYSFYTVAFDANTEQGNPSATAVTQLTIAPTCTTPATSSSTTWNVSYTTDVAPGQDSQDRLSEVDLFVEGPTDSSFKAVVGRFFNLSSGTFSYTATEGNGNYSFFIQAFDATDEQTGDSMTAVTQLTIALATASLTTPATSSSTTSNVSFTTDPGLSKVQLFAEGPTESGSKPVIGTLTNLNSGSLIYTPTAGNGSYSVFIAAIDGQASDSATAVMQLTIAPLSVTSTTPATSSSARWTVSYTAADTGGPGLSEVQLFAEGPTDSGFKPVVGTLTNLTSFIYTPTAGNGGYSIFIVVIDATDSQAGDSAQAVRQLS